MAFYSFTGAETINREKWISKVKDLVPRQSPRMWDNIASDLSLTDASATVTLNATKLVRGNHDNLQKMVIVTETGTETYFYLKGLQCAIMDAENNNRKGRRELDICFKQTTPGTYIIMGYALSAHDDSIDDVDLYSTNTLSKIKGKLRSQFNNPS